MRPRFSSLVLLFVLSSVGVTSLRAQSARLLRQPAASATQVAFTYGGDIWVSGRDGGRALRLTSTPAVEADPHFSPDGRWIAFTSNRAGTAAVFRVERRGRGLSSAVHGREAGGACGQRVLYLELNAVLRKVPKG